MLSLSSKQTEAGKSLQIQQKDLRGECEEFYNVCIQDDAGEADDCVVGALAQCGIL